MSRVVDPQGMRSIEISVSDLSEFRPLLEWVARVPAVEIEQAAGTPGPGEQGAVDVLTVLAGSGGVLAVAIRSLPEFIRSRRSDLTITVRIEEKEFTLKGSNLDLKGSNLDLKGSNLDDVIAVIGKLLHD